MLVVCIARTHFTTQRAQQGRTSTQNYSSLNMRTTICALLIAVLLCCEHSLVSSKRRKKSTDSSNQTKIYHPSKPRWPAFSSQTNINWESIYELTKKPTNRVLCKIFCRSGYHVQILSNGLVRGTVNQSSKYIVFEMQSFGPSLVKIKSVATGRYLAMKRDGTLKATRHANTRETIFKETHEMNAFLSYASHKYFLGQPHDMLVGIKRNGQVKKATKTKHGQTATQFLVIKY